MKTHVAVGNAKADTDAVKAGALCYVVKYSIATGSVEVYVVNRDGEWISEWRPGAALTNFRAKLVKPGHPASGHALSPPAARARAATLTKAFATSAAPAEEEPLLD